MQGDKINLSISSEKLAALIHGGHLCAADFSCLDAQSKHTVWQLCLWCCEKRIHCRQACSGACQRPETTEAPKTAKTMALPV